MLSYLLVGIGGAIGSVARFWMSGLIATRFGQTFPLGTLVVNVTGSFVIGLFAALSEAEGRWLVNPSFRQFFMIGVCGGYTTSRPSVCKPLPWSGKVNGFTRSRIRLLPSPSVFLLSGSDTSRLL